MVCPVSANFICNVLHASRATNARPLYTVFSMVDRGAFGFSCTSDALCPLEETVTSTDWDSNISSPTEWRDAENM
jgi:hypothetical protein